MNGKTLGPYRLDVELGSGGMGSVWRAQVVGRAPGLDAGAVVALKIVHPHLLETPGFFKRFLREAEIGRTVAHGNVVRTIDADSLVVDGARVDFIVMEYVEGRTLRGLLDDLGRVPEELCRHIGREVAKGLAAIHAAGAVHRDLKPENVLVTNDHTVKVMDLGVARLADEALRLSQSGVFVGSVEYAAPEQYRSGGGVDGRADLHALGVILYELATSQHPYRADDFRGVMRRVLDEAPRRPSEINPQLSPFFEELVLVLLAKDADQRFASADEAARVLDEGESSAWWKERAKAIRETTRRPLRRIRIQRETALHGRDAELARLRDLFGAAKSGDGRVVLVDGEAGIGKSRLVDEFVGVLQREGEDVNFLYGSYPPGGAATAAGAFSTAYREQFGDGGCAAWLTQTPILVPAFDALLRGETTPTGVEPLTKDSLQTVFVHATRNLAAERTTIVLIDDLHFAPEEGRALFAALAMAVPGHRILLVGTTRPGLDAKWLANMDRVGAARLPLARLGAKDLVRMLADAFRSERLAEELGAKIALKSDGNPFFVFEILRGLRDGQFLTRKDDGTWVTTRVIEEIQIPSSVLELVQARVADLARDERNALDVASCLGFEFDPSLVADVLGAGRIPLLQSLAHVEKAHRLVRSAGRRFVFDHHQVQEALYAGLPEMLREEYHAAIAAALETQSGAAATEPKDLDGALCVDLAEHYVKSAQATRALRYLDAALTHLEKGWLNDAAVRLADRALAAPGVVSGAARCDLLLRKANRLEVLARRDAEQAALEEARELADATGDRSLRARVRRSLARLLTNASRLDEAEAGLAEALELARAAGDITTEANVSGSLGVVHYLRGEYAEATPRYERQLALATQLGDVGMQAAATINIGAVRFELGRHADARARYERGLALARAAGNRRWETAAIGNLGIVCLQMGSHAEAQALYQRHLAMAREMGNRVDESIATGNLGTASFLLGRTTDARAQHERQLAMSRELGDRQGEVNALYSLGLIFGVLGDNARARASYELCLSVCRAIGARRDEGFVLLALAETAAEEGDRDEALRLVEESLTLRRELGDRGTIADVMLALGHLRAGAGDTDGARADFAQAAVLAREANVAAAMVLASAYAAALPGGDAASAIASFAEFKSRLAIRERMAARFSLWQATRDSAHIADARSCLDVLVEFAPPEYRESMVANVRLHREIAEASSRSE